MSESSRRIAELQRELATHPGSRQFYQLGELLRRDGRSREAAEALRSGLAHHPRYVAAWVALGRACVDAGQAAEAVQGLEQALALDRQNPVAWRLLGEAYLALGDRPSALDAWKQCIELVPGDDVLQSAVDGLSADLAAPPAPETPAADAPAAQALGAVQEVPAPAVLSAGPDASAAPPAPFEAEIATAREPAALEAQTFGWTEREAPQIAPGPAAPAPEVEAAAGWAEPEPPVSTDSAKVYIQPFAEVPTEAPPAAPGTPGRAAVTTDVAEGLFPEARALAPVEPPDVQGAAKEPVEELFTAPESEQAPAVLKAVLQAPSAPVSRALQSHQPATLALARLYVQQQALTEATRVLERLLEREPGNTEARDLLALVQDMMEPLPEAPPPLSRRERKIAALQHWLACLTLGQERATR